MALVLPVRTRWENLIRLADLHTYLGAIPGELSFSMGVLPDASGYCHVRCALVIVNSTCKHVDTIHTRQVLRGLVLPPVRSGN